MGGGRTSKKRGAGAAGVAEAAALATVRASCCCGSGLLLPAVLHACMLWPRPTCAHRRARCHRGSRRSIGGVLHPTHP